ncbi:MORN repeat-containing protein [Clostridium estertheticum]|uniref:MORN repeat-containing protein n=1 Tax=Clostridium estertheticum TaxID=238834 RepID=UPI001C7CCF35|nr:hypothetical protein [Clostridium estertheticum]MBX4271115.1 hypothetical protein [Clostridium estertheticum]WLC78349.1 hypothetical protein KTC98_14035 [Clostridium estertheticum]
MKKHLFKFIIIMLTCISFVGCDQANQVTEKATSNNVVTQAEKKPTTLIKSKQGASFKSGTYVGNSVDGKRQGKGKFTWKNGDEYDGEWLNDKMSGEGTFSYKSKDLYVGNYKDNLKSGQGIYTWENGETYNGIWANDTMNGIGEFDFMNGDSFQGKWKDGKMNGQGTYSFFENKKNIVKNWINNK